jgi:hypothetical protein
MFSIAGVSKQCIRKWHEEASCLFSDVLSFMSIAMLSFSLKFFNSEILLSIYAYVTRKNLMILGFYFPNGFEILHILGPIRFEL